MMTACLELRDWTTYCHVEVGWWKKVWAMGVWGVGPTCVRNGVRAGVCEGCMKQNNVLGQSCYLLSSCLLGVTEASLSGS